MRKAVGLIVNAIAGIGGSVGLKGTDGHIYKKALDLGAKPVTPKRTRDLLAHIERKDEMTLLVAPGRMGEQCTRRARVWRKKKRHSPEKE